MKTPFVGFAGQLLRQVLSNSKISGEQCFMGNICQHKPEGNDLSNFSWEGPEIQSGLARLRSDIDAYQPNAILCLGPTVLGLMRPDLVTYNKKGEQLAPIQTWRGSIFRGVWGYKCIAAFHPTYIQRVYNDIPYFRFDVNRAVQESANPELPEIRRHGILRPTFTQACDYLIDLRRKRQAVSCDLEGWPDAIGITMFSFCPTPYEGIVIPFWIDGHHYWQEDEEVVIWSLMADVLADPEVPKRAQNGFYEIFVCMWKHKMVINNLHEDSMLKHWEVFPELEKGLGVVGSIWTKEPYYKSDRLSDSTDVKLGYNFKDSAITHEACDSIESVLVNNKPSYDHYRFNIRLIPPIAFLNIRGCRLDMGLLQQHHDRTSAELEVFQTTVNSTLGREFNVKSVPQKQSLLYDELKYKPSARYGRCTDEGTLLGYYVKHRNPLIRTVIQAIRKRTRLSDIAKLVPDSDGRLRTSLDLVGTNTGRLSSRSAMSMYPTFDRHGVLKKWENSGTNLQNVTKELRDCLVPDSDLYDFWQFDLAGADGWTVAADLAALGHPTMLEDYRARIKPAKVLMLLLEEYEAGRNPALLNQLDRAEIKRRCDQLIIVEGERDEQGRPSDWKYHCCKAVQHGTNYDAKSPKIAELVFENSDGAIDLTTAQVGVYQFLYKLRYRPEVRNEWIARELKDKGGIQSAPGITRKFYGIRSRTRIDDNIVREASAFEPQAVTTYCTNRALEKLWYDPQNRQSSSWLHIEPLLQIHDALAGQYHSSLRGWVLDRFNTYFDNPITIHGVEVKIPADGGWGTSWKNCKNPL